jgi:WD40 repeat protein
MNATFGRWVSLVLLVGGAAGASAQGEKKVRTDRHGDALPAGALTRLGTTRLRHKDVVTLVAILPGGKELLSTGLDQTARIWDVRTGRELRRFSLTVRDDRGRWKVFGHSDVDVTLSSDGKVLVTYERTGQVHLWDIASGKEGPRLKRMPRLLACLAVSPDGKAIATLDQLGSVRLWDVALSKELRSFAEERKGDAPRQSPSSINFTPDGKALIVELGESGTADIKKVIQVWDVKTGKLRHRIESAAGYGGPTLVIAPHGKVMAWIDNDNSVTLADLSTGKTVSRIQKGPALAPEMALSPDGNILFGKKGDIKEDKIVAWDVVSGKVLRTLAPSGRRSAWLSHIVGRQLAVSPDGKLLACCGEGNVIRLLDAQTGKEVPALGGHQAPVFSVNYSRDGKTLTTHGADRTVRLWDVAKGVETGRVPLPEFADVFLVSPDGRRLVTSGVAGVKLWDAVTGKELHQLVADTEATIPGQFAFTPDGKTLAVRGYRDGAIRMFDVGSGKELCSFALPTEKPKPREAQGRGARRSSLFLISPDGKVLVTPAQDNGLVLWDVVVGRPLGRLKLPPGQAVSRGAFTPDGRSLALESGTGGINLWEVATGAVRRSYGKKPQQDPSGREGPGGRPAWGRPQTSSSPPPALALSPDGRSLALADNSEIHVWDVVTGLERGRFRGEQGTVLTLTFSSDGRTLASAGADTTVLVWDVAGLGGAAAKKELDKAGLKQSWDDLAGEPGKGFDAVCALALSPKLALALLRQRLRPAVPVAEEKISQFVADLDSGRFAVRSKARRKLEGLGARALPALRRALEGRLSAEARKHVQELLDRAGSGTLSGEALRLVRAVEVLERLGTPEARAVLKTLAGGAPGALETTEARAALARLLK